MGTDRQDAVDAAARLARTAAGHTLSEVADAADVNPDTLRRRLETMRWRGRCDDLLATNADSLRARRVAATLPRWPPAAKRVAASKLHRLGDGTATWSVQLADTPSRAQRRVSAPRMRTADPVLAANHKQCPPLLLVHLSDSPADRVRRSLIDNWSCPQGALHKLASDPSSWVRSQFVASGRCPHDLLERLAETDPSPHVRNEAHTNLVENEET